MRIRTCLVVVVAAATVSVRVAAQAGTDLRTQIRSWLDTHQQAVVSALVDTLSIPNVAADRENIRRNATHLRDLIVSHGLKAEILETTGNPLVYGSLDVPGATRTVLFYCHYDGQPVNPPMWKQASPFAPVLRSGRVDQGGTDLGDPKKQTRYEADWRIYARSASDDKSPIIALLAAIRAIQSSGLQPTSNVRLILDGEEEASSPSLVPAIGRYRDRLKADIMVILDGPAHSSGRPTLVYGARGIATVDLTVFGPRSGVHSGNYGNWIPNPAQRLASLLASMKDDEGHVLVSGYTDGVAQPTADERAMMEAVPDERARMLAAFGVAAPEKAYPTLQQALVYPTLNVRGLISAHVGADARTIIPDSATAALDLRLVKETRGKDLIEKLRAHIERQGYHLVDDEPDDATRAKYPKIARLRIAETITEAFRTSPSDPLAAAISASMTRTYGAPPVRLRTLGGTVPIAPFIEALGFPAVLVPIVNFDNNQHEENENLRLGAFFDGIVTIAAVLRM